MVKRIPSTDSPRRLALQARRIYVHSLSRKISLLSESYDDFKLRNIITFFIIGLGSNLWPGR